MVRPIISAPQRRSVEAMNPAPGRPKLDSRPLGGQRPAQRRSVGAYVFRGAIFCSMAPKTLWPSLPFISMRMVSPNFM
jgi:hypothetical protein